jgi:hypothetical protein
MYAVLFSIAFRSLGQTPVFQKELKVNFNSAIIYVVN